MIPNILTFFGLINRIFSSTRTWEKDFELRDCASCSVWQFNVKCDMSGKSLLIIISKCTQEGDYSVEVQDQMNDEKECAFDKDDFPTSKPALERFLAKNFTRTNAGNPCTELGDEGENCPICNDNSKNCCP